jgi:CDP-diacylglycerol--glycerol-3-phosphate 3-phosphatidyltransferase/cardiolipin synthase
MAQGTGIESGTVVRRTWGVADVLTVLRIPLAVAFVIVADTRWRLAILAAAAASDLLDGWIARRFGPSRFGSFIDPVADKLFMACAFGVVLFSGRLAAYEIVALLARDIVAAAAFLATVVRRHPLAIPARAGGKAVTVLQALTLLAFLLDSSLLRPMAWATGAVGLYAIWDYRRVASRARRVGEG